MDDIKIANSNKFVETKDKIIVYFRNMPSYIVPFMLAILLFGVDSFLQAEMHRKLEMRVEKIEEHVKTLKVLTNENFKRIQKHENTISIRWNEENKKEDKKIEKDEGCPKQKSNCQRQQIRRYWNYPVLNWFKNHHPFRRLIFRGCFFR